MNCARSVWLAVAITAAAITCACAAPSSASGELARPLSVGKKIAARERAKPVAVNGVVYEAPVDGKVMGLGQNGGYLMARDAATGALLWNLKIYEIRYSANMEADKQDIFIAEMEASSDANSLLLTDERGRRWRVDLNARTASSAD